MYFSPNFSHFRNHDRVWHRLTSIGIYTIYNIDYGVEDIFVRTRIAVFSQAVYTLRPIQTMPSFSALGWLNAACQLWMVFCLSGAAFSDLCKMGSPSYTTQGF